ncbi:putative Late nodulin [Medicago truncatula]|uniref:Putative Late nodulin n=1 Tax=Medicago truncatula TaxID=3880 RepID=A0A396JB63_MEDTR|nr:putative Late nodulin [Medicago truncatula]
MNNMVETCKYFYVVILFLFIFIMATDGVYLCEDDEDCHIMPCMVPEYAKCIRMICQCC